jgi:hypothetical protein
MHFTPTRASWLNMVERFFRDITDKRIRRDSFTSVTELELAIDPYVTHYNIDPKPFIRTASAEDILAKVTRAKATLAAAAGQVENRAAHCTSADAQLDVATSLGSLGTSPELSANERDQHLRAGLRILDVLTAVGRPMPNQDSRGWFRHQMCEIA